VFHVRARTLVLVPAVAAIVCGLLLPVGAEASPVRTPEECAITLDCSAADIDAMSATDRLVFVRDLQAGPAQLILAGFDRWRNIEGVLEFFIDHGWSTPGTWVSDVDAGILEGAERGLAIALGRSTDTFGNPGAPKWADYLTRLRHGELLADRSTHDRVWGDAEQTSTDWGTTIASRRGHQPTGVQSRWFQFTELYRFMLSSRPAVLDEIGRLGALLDSDLANFKIPFYDWATDVRSDVPARQGAEAFYRLVTLHVIGAGESSAALLAAYLPVMFDEFKAETGPSLVY
jgi:hypothetical protein